MAQTGPPQSLWARWKSLKLPWRRKWLVGQDLSGTTFWELHNPEAPWRPRRIALPAHGRQSLLSAASLQLSPAWIQWLRHTRPVAPTLHEQQLDLQRQMQLKQLAAAADARWEQKPRISDNPADTAQLEPGGPLPRDTTTNRQPNPVQHQDTEEQPHAPQHEHPQQQQQTSTQSHQTPTDKTSPWARQRANPGDEWQPASWKPDKAERR